MFNFGVKGKYIPSNFYLLLLVNNLISLCDQKLLFISFLLYDTALWHFTTAALANCHQLSIWSQDKFIFSTALELRSPVGLEGLSVSGLTKQKLRCQLNWTLSRNFGIESASRFILVAGRIQFNVFVGLSSLFPCWL